MGRTICRRDRTIVSHTLDLHVEPLAHDQSSGHGRVCLWMGKDRHGGRISGGWFSLLPRHAGLGRLNGNTAYLIIDEGSERKEVK